MLVVLVVSVRNVDVVPVRYVKVWHVNVMPVRYVDVVSVRDVNVWAVTMVDMPAAAPAPHFGPSLNSCLI